MEWGIFYWSGTDKNLPPSVHKLSPLIDNLRRITRNLYKASKRLWKDTSGPASLTTILFSLGLNLKTHLDGRLAKCVGKKEGEEKKQGCLLEYT